MRNLRTDNTWNGGCETVTRSGKRRGKLCNNRFYGQRVMPDGCTLKSCYMHLEGAHQDVEHDQSFYNEGIDDQIESNDFDFIASEEDGTVLVNGKVFVKEEPESTQNFPQENVYEVETESEYDPQDEETEDETDISYAEDSDETENVSQSMPNENFETVNREPLAESDRFFYYKYLEEKEKCDRFEIKNQEYKFALEAEKKKFDDYKREIAASLSNHEDFDDEKEKLVNEINSFKVKLESSEKEKVKLSEDINAEKAKVESLEQLIIDERVKNTDHATRSLKWQGTILKEQIDTLKNEIETYKNKEKNAKSLEKLINDKNKTIYDLNCHIEKTVENVESLEKSLQDEKLLQKLGDQINKDKIESMEKLLSDERAEKKELKSRLHEIFKTTNGFQTNIRAIMIASGFCIDEGVGFE